MSVQLNNIEVDMSAIVENANVEVIGAILNVTTVINDGKVSSKLHFLGEHKIKDALIKLGWTPPQESSSNYV